MSPARPSVSVRWRRIRGLSDVALGSYVPIEHLAFPARLIANESVVGPTVPHTIATPSLTRRTSYRRGPSVSCVCAARNASDSDENNT
jgi:hypothetical protein